MKVCGMIVLTFDSFSCCRSHQKCVLRVQLAYVLLCDTQLCLLTVCTIQLCVHGCSLCWLRRHQRVANHYTCGGIVCDGVYRWR